MGKRAAGDGEWLIGMRERIGAVGGEFAIVSSPAPRRFPAALKYR
jgi:signal transduction histidine kinase